MYEMKPFFEERIRALLKDEADFQEFNKIVHTSPRSFIRCNTLKISPNELFERLNKKWKVVRPFKEFSDIFLIESFLEEDVPGVLGNSLEHVMGYFYVQEISSMMSIIALNPKPGDFVLDLCASPGSKTTQMASYMNNEGSIIANDRDINRIKILGANLERCGVTNTVVTRNDGVQLCEKLLKSDFRFDKILLDAPCSGEGTLRSSPKTFNIWNYKVVGKLSREQKKLFASAVKLLKVGGEMVYSTCTHSPEENEEIVDFALKNFPVKVEKINLPLKCRPGIKQWKEDTFNPEVEKTCRIYPQDNDSEGFFVSKFKLLEEIK